MRKGMNNYQKFQTEQRKMAAKEAKYIVVECPQCLFQFGTTDKPEDRKCPECGFCQPRPAQVNRIDPLAKGKTMNELIAQEEAMLIANQAAPLEDGDVIQELFNNGR